MEEEGLQLLKWEIFKGGVYIEEWDECEQKFVGISVAFSGCGVQVRLAEARAQFGEF